MAKVRFGLDDFAQGGGLLFNDADVHIKTVRACKYNYGKADMPEVLALHVVMEPVDEEKKAIMEASGGKISGDQYYSFGSSELVKKLKIVDGGKAFDDGGKEVKLPQNSNAYHFLKSLADAGCDIDFEDDFSVLDDIVVHVAMKVPAGREDFKPQASFTGEVAKGPKEVLLVTNYDEEATAEVRGATKPKATAKAAVKTAIKGKAKPAPEPELEVEPGDTISEQAIEHATAVLDAANGKPLTIGAFNAKMLRATSKLDTHEEIMDFIKDTDNLETIIEGAGYVLKGDTLKAA